MCTYERTLARPSLIRARFRPAGNALTGEPGGRGERAGKLMMIILLLLIIIIIIVALALLLVLVLVLKLVLALSLSLLSLL